MIHGEGLFNTYLPKAGGLQSCVKGSFGSFESCVWTQRYPYPGTLISLSLFQILHILKRHCQGQKHNVLARGKPQRKPRSENNSWYVENGRPADLADSGYCGALWKAIKSLEENKRTRKGKVEIIR